MSEMERRNALVEKIDAKTREAEKLYYKKEEEKLKLSPKAKKVKEFIDKDPFGCNSEAVASLMSIMLEEKIEYDGDEGNVKYGDFSRSFDAVGCAFVVERNNNGHEYEIGETVVANRMDSSFGNAFNAMKKDGETANWLNFHAVRPATREEIESFVDSLIAESDPIGKVESLLQ